MSGKEVSYDCDFFSYENAELAKTRPQNPHFERWSFKAALKRTAKYGEAG